MPAAPGQLGTNSTTTTSVSVRASATTAPPASQSHRVNRAGLRWILLTASAKAIPTQTAFQPMTKVVAPTTRSHPKKSSDPLGGDRSFP